MLRFLFSLIVFFLVASSAAQAQEYLITGTQILASPSAFNSPANDALNYYPLEDADIRVAMSYIGMPASVRQYIRTYASRQWNVRRGQNYRAWVQAKVNYTVCASVIRYYKVEPSYCGSHVHFVGVVGAVGKPKDNPIDGLHLTYDVPLAGNGLDQKACHLHALVMTVFVDARIGGPNFCQILPSQSYHRGN